MLNEARINSLTRELEVLDAQRRGLAAELRSLAGHRVNPGSVIATPSPTFAVSAGPPPRRRSSTHHRRAPAAESACVRGHPVPGRAAEADRERGPWAPRIDASTPASATTSRAADAPGPARPCGRLRRRRGRGRDVAGTMHRTRGRMARPDAGGRGRRRGRPPRPLSGPRTGGGTQHGPPRRADTRAGNQRDRIAVQGVAADPSASSAGRAAAVLDEPPRCREHRGARPRHRRARHA